MKKKNKRNAPAADARSVRSQANSIWMMLTDGGKNNPPLPFGRQADPVIDLKCDEWCRQYFSGKNVPVAAPPDILPWILARIAAASLMVETYARFGEPLEAKTADEVLMELMVEGWEKSLSRLWPRFKPHVDGKSITFDFSKLNTASDLF